MLFWHIGGAVFLFRTLFKDPDVDLRFLAAGAILPDVIDLPIGLLLQADQFRTGRVYGHTLLFSIGVLMVGMWTTRPRSRDRQRGMAVAVGVMFHLLLDWIWVTPELLLWPLSGWGFPTGIEGDWSGLPGSLLHNPARPAQEVGGLAYLLWLGHRSGLSDPARRSRLWRTGTITTKGGDR